STPHSGSHRRRRALRQRDCRGPRTGAALGVEAPAGAAERRPRNGEARAQADSLSHQRRGAAPDSRLVRDVRPALARTTPAHQSTHGGKTMTTTASAAEHQTFTLTEEISVQASLEQTFASLLANMGRLNETPDGAPLPMVLEAHPGGRWYRELGGDNGHLW